jgi:hypothetical protein
MNVHHQTLGVTNWNDNKCPLKTKFMTTKIQYKNKVHNIHDNKKDTKTFTCFFCTTQAQSISTCNEEIQVLDDHQNNESDDVTPLGFISK